MSVLVETYGDFHCLYSGTGKLNGNKCEFELGQKPDGTIRVCCISGDLWLDNDQFELEGTVDSSRISASGKTIRTKSSVTFSSGSSSLNCYHYRSAGEFRVELGNASWHIADKVRFQVANFRFDGNEQRRDSSGKCRAALCFDLEGLHFAFLRANDYEAKEKMLSVYKGVEVTGELELETGDRTRDEVMGIVGAICSLLSIARGTMINWISYDLLDSDSQIVGKALFNRITRPYSSISIVKSSVIPQCTVNFLKESYPTYSKQNTHYRFDYLAHFLSELHGYAFLETRCLLLFAVAETLARKVCNTDNARSRLRAFVDEHSMKAEVCEHGLCGTSEHKCSEGCEVGVFVRDRGSFVHEMRFEKSSIEDGYFRNLGFLHRMVLAALDYQGDIYDWSEGNPGWE